MTKHRDRSSSQASGCCSELVKEGVGGTDLDFETLSASDGSNEVSSFGSFL